MIPVTESNIAFDGSPVMLYTAVLQDEWGNEDVVQVWSPSRERIAEAIGMSEYVSVVACMAGGILSVEQAYLEKHGRKP